MQAPRENQLKVKGNVNVSNVNFIITFKMADSEENTDKIRGKKDTNICWKWDDTKTVRILEISKAYKRQKLGEGLEWDSDKVVLFESLGVF